MRLLTFDIARSIIQKSIVTYRSLELKRSSLRNISLTIQKLMKLMPVEWPILD